MRILVRKGGQKMWVSNPEKIKFWEALANQSSALAQRLGSGTGSVEVLKRVK